MTTGDFNGDGEAVDAAVGMPRGHGLRGQVIIYDSSLTNLYNITGNQIGAYFVSLTFRNFNCNFKLRKRNPIYCNRKVLCGDAWYRIITLD